VIGIDTSFLVAFELREHPSHHSARTLAESRREEGFAMSTQIPAEFLHVVTDPRRFAGWRAREVRIVPTGDAVGVRFLDLVRHHHLGRKRLLDTLLAATYLEAGVHVIATTDARDFGHFEGLGVVPV